jgi:glycosyltransferase involved in cell wall biosynthesis
MKIIYIITKSEWGGAQVHLYDLVKHAIKNNNKCTVIVGDEGELTDRLRNLGVKIVIISSLVREISPLKDMKCIYRMVEVLKNENPDLIHLHSSKAGLVGRIAAKIAKFPVIFTAHGWSFTEGISINKVKIFLIIERLAAKITNKIICVSEFDRQLALNNKVGSHMSLVTIHNGVEYKETKHQIKENIIPKLIMVARFSSQKDYETLTLALSKIKGEFEIQYVGEGELLTDIKDLVLEKKLGEKVKFLGMRKDVNMLLEQSNIFVLVSNYEGLPISIIEAMAAKLPVIATNVGGVNELIEDNKNGFLINRKDVNNLVEKLQLLIDNRELQLKMGKAGFEKYKNSFTVTTMLDKTFKVYEDVLSK